MTATGQRQAWRAMNVWSPAPTADPLQRTDVPAALTYHRDQPVWVYREGGWLPGEVGGSGPLAVLVRYLRRGGGSVTDTVMPEYVIARED